MKIKVKLIDPLNFNYIKKAEIQLLLNFLALKNMTKSLNSQIFNMSLVLSAQNFCKPKAVLKKKKKKGY